MNIIKKETFFRWVMPFFLGVVMFNVLRAVTDLTKNEGFWTGSFRLHIVSQLIVIGICYAFDIIWRLRFQNKKNDISKQGLFQNEYLKTFIALFIGLNTVMFIGERLGVLYMGNGIIDYMLANVVCIPISLFYYAMIRSDMINNNFIEQALLLEKIRNENLDTELKYLKAQYHPHFLFNALNTIYFQTKEETARNSIELLSELLRYQLYNVNKRVTIGQEIKFIQSYIRFQKQRVSKRLILTADYGASSEDWEIHPLLFQPLLENAFKYVGGEYWIFLYFEVDGDTICFSIENSIADLREEERGKKNGIGIENLRRRLELLYPSKHQLQLIQKEKSFFAELRIKVGMN
ncbi:MAG: histidine kinase [Massilibacteroides sp.]|nr:histidine kinase [Massilibacteroides sp.]MDD3061731.1 histidine kinase [Massilibacteroides sp.]MDD4115161.1 histidine kinase [Massilibacteroides sp.]MDD4660614.1 histidine kinase [Massilibacteroides sp.]